jgi:hypothetical protein
MAYYVTYYRDRELKEPTGEYYALSDHDLAEHPAPYYDVAVARHHTNTRLRFGYDGEWHDNPPGPGKLPGRVSLNRKPTGNQQMKYAKLAGDTAVEDDRHVTLEVGVAQHSSVYLALRFRDTDEGHAVILTPVEVVRLIAAITQSVAEVSEENLPAALQ